MHASRQIDRRGFLRRGATLSGAVTLGSLHGSSGAVRKIKVGVIGCGSVSQSYLAHLARSPFVELVSTCDILPERARQAADRHKIPHHYPHIDEMLAGASFDLFVNLTDLQEHERLNEQALQAGKHVWSEKPIANSLAGGQRLLELAHKKGVRLWGAPTTVQSPQFAFMAKTLAEGKLGRLAAAHGSYGHLGPNWAPFFYTEGGGSLPDLAVYNLTTLTGLLGPVRSVVAMTGVVTPTRQITGEGEIPVTAEDNAMILMDHGNGLFSHVQSGFNYFTPHEHSYTQQDHHTITITGAGGSMSLAGYDWAPHAVDLATREHSRFQRHADARSDYVWENGASLVAECLATGREPLFTPEHALHVVDIMTSANGSQKTGRRIPMRSTFQWPLV